MHEDAFEVIDLERASDALSELARAQHEMLAEELATAGE
jgi:hypothetical protein